MKLAGTVLKVIIILFFLAAGVVSAETDSLLNLTIIHLNDTHSYIDGSKEDIKLPRFGHVVVNIGEAGALATKIAQIRKGVRHSLFLHAGDMAQGTLYYNEFASKLNVCVFNYMDLEVFATGNHEFDRKPEGYAEFLKGILFPVVTANADFTNDKHLNGFIKPYVIKEYDGQRVGIIGLITEETPKISFSGEDVQFLDNIQTAQRYINELLQVGVNNIILLTHIGYDEDKALAQSITGADIIIGGHSHTLLGEEFRALGLSPEGAYPTVIKDKGGANVLIVQAWKWGKVLGVIDVGFDKGGNVTKYKARPVMVTTEPFFNKMNEPLGALDTQLVRKEIAENPLIELTVSDYGLTDYLKPYREKVRGFSENVIGWAKEKLIHIYVPTPANPTGSQVATVVTDAMLWKTRLLYGDVSIALQNAGGIRADIELGNMTEAQVKSILPFKNTLYTFELTGKEIKTVLEQALNHTFQSSSTYGSFPYVSGVRYYAKTNVDKTVNITAIDIDSNGKWTPLSPSKTYTLVTNSYIARGKDGYDLFKGKNNGKDTGLLDSTVFTEYVKYKGKIELGRQHVFLQ